MEKRVTWARWCTSTLSHHGEELLLLCWSSTPLLTYRLLSSPQTPLLTTLLSFTPLLTTHSPHHTPLLSIPHTPLLSTHPSPYNALLSFPCTSLLTTHLSLPHTSLLTTRFSPYHEIRCYIPSSPCHTPTSRLSTTNVQGWMLVHCFLSCHHSFAPCLLVWFL